MTDREKVVGEFERWCDEMEDECPVICLHALAMLKEQEAVEPNPVHNSYRWFACGKCDCSITREDRFCPRCGQAVKWE